MGALDVVVWGNAPYDSLDWRVGQRGCYEELPHASDGGYEHPASVVSVSGKAFLDPLGVRMDARSWWDNELRDATSGGDWDDPDDYPEDGVMIYVFPSGGVKVERPMLRNASDDDMAMVALVLREMGVPGEVRLTWVVDEERRQRVKLDDFYSRVRS